MPGSTRPTSGVLWQIGLQLRHHLAPLARIHFAELATPAVAIAVLVFVSGFAIATRSDWTDLAAGPSRRVIAITGLLGLAHAVLGYLPFVLTRGIRGPVRTEFLSAAGVAAFIAAAVMLIASLAPPRTRLVLAAALGAWVVALGTGRTMAFQREWDSRLYANQRRALQQISRTSLLEAWPQQLGPLPAGATYAPRLRIRVDCPISDRLAIVPELR